MAFMVDFRGDGFPKAPTIYHASFELLIEPLSSLVMPPDGRQLFPKKV
jgi:hypothetical protein